MGEATAATGRGGQTMAIQSTGEGFPVVLLHGIPGSGQTWDGVVERLSPVHRVVVPDLLGFGSSGTPTGARQLHAEAQAAALGDALDALGIERMVVAGHDFGGPVAVTFTQAHPERVAGLALLATNAFTDTPIPFPLSLVTAPVAGPAAARLLFSRPSLAMMVRRGFGPGSSPADLARYLGDKGELASMRTIFAASLQQLAELYRPIEDALGAISVPTVVGWGDHDPFFPVEHGRRTAQAIPGAELRLYEGAGHFLPEERPEALAADIALLVARVRR